jgi:hypothetical protein
MQRLILVTLAAFAFACGGTPDRNDMTAAAPAGEPTPSAAANGEPERSTPADAEQTVALVGCLRGPSPSAATGTAGTPSSTERYTLADATPDTLDGVGANGAGGTGGPLVSGKATYDLDEVPNGARDGVNKQVRITGLIDARPIGAESGATGTAGSEGRSPTTNRRVEVQSVEVIAEACAP